MNAKSNGISLESENSSIDRQNVSSSSSLLDILISTEQSNEPDPLDDFGNIGEAVIGQFAESFGMNQNFMENEFKMFDESYLKGTINSQKQTKTGSSPRTKMDFDCSDIFPQGFYTNSQFELLHDKLEKSRNNQFEELINKDAERLLQNVNRIYGPKEWSPEEKAEFTSYCKILRSGKLSDEDKMSLQNFYARAYQEEYGNKLEGKETLDEEKINDILASKSAVSFPIQTEFIREESKEEEEGRPSPNGLSDNLEPVPLTHFDPAVKYGKEKEFRYAANKIFLKVFQHYSSTNSNCSEEEKRVKDVVNLIEKINEFMNEKHKKWKDEEARQLFKYYNTFQERMHFTIVQSKELGHFIRKVFGKLEKYEIERENNTTLQEKRKYWQEYKKTHPEKKERKQSNSVRSYVRTNIIPQPGADMDKRLRKAAYLRQWRIAQKEKAKNQIVSQISGYSVTNEK